MILLGLVLIILSASLASAASLKLTVTPEAATANSVWVFMVEAADFKSGPYPTSNIWNGSMVVLNGVGSGSSLIGGYPMYAAGVFYKAALSGGLNMSSVYQRADGNDEFLSKYITPRAYDISSFYPDPNNNKVIWHYQQFPMWYAEALAKEIVSPNPEVLTKIIATAYDYDVLNKKFTLVKSNEVSVTIHASRYETTGMDFGGIFDGVGDSYERYGDKRLFDMLS